MIARLLAARWRELRSEADCGNAIVEFIFVAVIFILPLIYLIAAVAEIQREQLAVQEAARNAGRAFATSDTQSEAMGRAQAAVALALGDQGLPQQADVRFVAAGSSCTGAATVPRLQAGAEFAVCVSRRTRLLGVPAPFGGNGIGLSAEFVVHVDDYRAFPSS